jgi:hypothetical protein
MLTIGIKQSISTVWYRRTRSTVGLSTLTRTDDEEVTKRYETEHGGMVALCQ